MELLKWIRGLAWNDLRMSTITSKQTEHEAYILGLQGSSAHYVQAEHAYSHEKDDSIDYTFHEKDDSIDYTFLGPALIHFHPWLKLEVTISLFFLLFDLNGDPLMFMPCRTRQVFSNAVAAVSPPPSMWHRAPDLQVFSSGTLPKARPLTSLRNRQVTANQPLLKWKG